MHHSTPAPARLAWATLGLLAASWLMLSALLSFALIWRFPDPPALIMSVLLALFYTGPHALLGYSAWRGSANIEIAVLAFGTALLLTAMSAVLLVGVFRDPMDIGGLFCTALSIWGLAWSFGVGTLSMTRYHSQDSPPPED